MDKANRKFDVADYDYYVKELLKVYPNGAINNIPE